MKYNNIGRNEVLGFIIKQLSSEFLTERVQRKQKYVIQWKYNSVHNCGKIKNDAEE